MQVCSSSSSSHMELASKFGQKLAHVEKKIRRKALHSLAAFLGRNSHQAGQESEVTSCWSAMDLQKIWKALFYTMWMSDKVVIQQELAEALSQLVHRFPCAQDGLMFLRTFFQTMHREWHGIDGLRMNKFYSLIRKMVHQAFLFAQRNKDEKVAQEWTDILTTEVLTKLPNGLRLHVLDVYVNEMGRAVAPELTVERFMIFLSPFLTLLKSCEDKVVRKRVKELVFMKLLSEGEFGEEKKEIQSSDGATAETDDESEEEEQNHLAFPLVDLAYLQYALFELAALEDIPQASRTALYDLYTEYYKVTGVDSSKGKPCPKPPSQLKKDKSPLLSKTKAQTEKSTLQIVDSVGDAKKNKKSKKRALEETKVNSDEMGKQLTQASQVTSPVIELAAPDAKKTQKNKKKKKDKEPSLIAEKDSDSKPLTVTKTEHIKKLLLSNQVDAQSEIQNGEKATSKVTEAVGEATKKSKKNKKRALDETEVALENQLVKASKKQGDALKKDGEMANQVDPKLAATLYPRCALCGGWGKNFLKPSNSMCEHCIRSKKAVVQKTMAKKEKSAPSNKASSEGMARASTNTPNKKSVSFGKNMALDFKTSINRLKASKMQDSDRSGKSPTQGALKKQSSYTAPIVVKKGGKGLTKKRSRAMDFF